MAEKLSLKDRLKSVKGVKSKEMKKEFIRHLVIGDDLFSLATYDLLKNKFQKEEVGFLSPRTLVDQDFTFLGPSMLRGKSNLETFAHYFPEQADETQFESLFYKEMKFHEFNKRTKSLELLFGEDFYVNSRIDFPLEMMFPFINKTEVISSALSELRVNHIKEINYFVATDLFESATFEIIKTNGEIIYCEYLYFGLGPKMFLELFKNKNELTDQFIEFCDEIQTKSMIGVSFEFKKEVSKNRETLFIPLSYTHDWGHFIGEFSSFNSDLGIQKAEFISFIDEDHTTEEEISKKIKILKRNLEKIFPDLSFENSKEYIKYSGKVPCQNIDDKKFPHEEFKSKKLCFIGFNAPFDHQMTEVDTCVDSCDALSHLMRGFVTHQKISQNVLTAGI